MIFKALLIMFMVCSSLSLYSKTDNKKTKLCTTPSGKKVDCKLLKEAKEIIAIKKAQEENERLQQEIELLRKKSQNGQQVEDTTTEDLPVVDGFSN